MKMLFPIRKKSLIPLTYVEIDLNAVRHNLKSIRQLASQNTFRLPTRAKIKKRQHPVNLLTVIKAEAYGHGMKEVAKVLNHEGITFFAVSDVTEGKGLRQAGIRKPILLFESTLPEFAKDIIDYRLMPTVCTFQLAKELNHYAKSQKKRIDIHIMVDTGMARLGVWHEEAFEFIEKIYQLKALRILGIYTHFPVADSDKRFTKKQIQTLYDLVVKLDKKGMVIPYIHAANSMGLAGYKTHVLNLVRPGLMIYGLYPDARLRNRIKLKPVMRVKSKIILIKRIKRGTGVSYGRTFVAKKDMTIAIIPIGYNDGYLRNFSNKADVLIESKRCPVLGHVTMDQIVVDISKVKRAALGKEVVILGKQGRHEVSADELARYANTINYEIVCSLGNRLPRVYI